MNPRILKTVPLFSSLSDEQLRVLQPCLQQRSYPRRSFILRAGEEIDGMWIVKQAPPKQEIARMIGASREMVSRVVRDLQQRGYIRTEKRKVFLLDKISMAKRASSS